MENNTAETLRLLKDALQGGGDERLAKAFLQSATATAGLTAYSLEAPAKTLYPVITPLRNMIPRVSGGTGIQANWKAITGINTANLSAGVSQGNRGGVIATAVADYLAAFKGIGLEDYATFEADYAAQGFDDVRARAQQGLLRALMIQEEAILLGGNSGLALGTTPTPACATSGTGGTIGATVTVQVVCVALTLEGYRLASVANGVVQTTNRTNADGSVDTVNGGTATPSAVGSVATGGGTTNSVTATVTPVRGAVAYAWFTGSGGTQRITAITTINSVLITALPGAGQTVASLTAADYSRNSLVFDGLLTMAQTAANGSYYANMATGTAGTGTPLTADATGGIAEIDVALQWFWDNLRLSPSKIWVSSQEMNFLRKKVLTGSSSAAQRFVFQASQNGLMGGTAIKGYTNPFTMGEAEEIPFKLHPNLPPGTILFTTEQVPYPLSGVSQIMQVLTRQEYYSLEWPRRSRKYEYGVYADEVLQHYFPPSLGVITNIAGA